MLLLYLLFLAGCCCCHHYCWQLCLVICSNGACNFTFARHFRICSVICGLISGERVTAKQSHTHTHIQTDVHTDTHTHTYTLTVQGNSSFGVARCHHRFDQICMHCGPCKFISATASAPLPIPSLSLCPSLCHSRSADSLRDSALANAR